MSQRRKLGFSLMEVLVAIVLAGAGLAYVIGAFGVLDKAEAKTLSREKLQRYAQQKLDELIGTAQLTSQSGDFSDQGRPDVHWNFDVQTTSVTDLDGLSMTVTMDGDDTAKVTLSTLRYTKAASGGSSTAASGGTNP